MAFKKAGRKYLRGRGDTAFRRRKNLDVVENFLVHDRDIFLHVLAQVARLVARSVGELSCQERERMHVSGRTTEEKRWRDAPRRPT